MTRSMKAELRGGESTLKLLTQLKSEGASFCIVTAKCDGKLAIERYIDKLPGQTHVILFDISIVARLKPLGIDAIFAGDNVKGEVVKIDGIQFAIAGNCVGKRLCMCWFCLTFLILTGAAFNKPEGLHAFLVTKNLRPKQLIFVDDVADHVINIHEYFRQKYPDLIEKMNCVWWPVDVPDQFQPKEQTPDAVQRFTAAHQSQTLSNLLFLLY